MEGNIILNFNNSLAFSLIE